MFVSSYARNSVLRLARSGAIGPVAGRRARPQTALFSTTAKPSLTHLIKELRSSTGAPMVDCKKALSDPEVDGDVDKAAEWLRKHGSAKALSKVGDREASEGLVGLLLAPDGRSAALVRVASETDFASRSEAFGKLVEDVAEATLGLEGDNGDVDIEGTLLSANTGTGTVGDAMDEAILAIRENLKISEASRMVSKDDGDDAIFVGYVHRRVPGSTCAGASAALVEIGKADANSDATRERIEEAGKKLAMHVVASKPMHLTPADVPEELVQKEKDILMEQMADSGKPPEILEKIINGRLGKFYEGICLTEQPHMVEEKSPKVSKALGKIGLEVRSFLHKSIS